MWYDHYQLRPRTIVWQDGMWGGDYNIGFLPNKPLYDQFYEALEKGNPLAEQVDDAVFYWVSSEEEFEALLDTNRSEWYMKEHF